MFCTYVTIYRGNRLPPFYIGYTTTKNIEKGYRGSVLSAVYKDVWQQELVEHPHLFRTIILSTHSTRQEAIDKEVRLQKSLNVHSNPLYTNLCINKCNYNHDDPITRKKMSESARNRPPMSDSTRKIMSVQRRGRKKSAEHRKNIGLSNTGSKRTEIQKAHISEGCKNQPKESCRHCGLITTRSNIKRWHNDNCRSVIHIDLVQERGTSF